MSLMALRLGWTKELQKSKQWKANGQRLAISTTAQTAMSLMKSWMSMFYFDKQDPQVLFTDIREYHDTLCDGRKLDVQPDMIADCTNLPFEDETFNMVVFDPPHLLKVGQNSWLCKKYGRLPENWQAFINNSIHEGMRVLKTNGTLIFKWNEQQINVSDVLKAITDYKPIFGHRTTIKNQTIWMAFMK